MDKKELEKRVIVSVTGRKKKDWQDKIKEINKRKIKTAAVFLSAFPKEERQGLYEELLNSCIVNVPLVHLRDDSTKEDINFFIKNFNTKYFTIHEDHFKVIGKWKGHYKDLFLEMNYDNSIPKNLDVGRTGGFCVDLSHFKLSEEVWGKDFQYILGKMRSKKYFACNHINGYNYKKKKEVHAIKNLEQFSYLETLPNFIFGKVIAIETWNTIEEQLKFKKKIICILSRKL